MMAQSTVTELTPLRPYWHPVALVSEVGERPLGTRLLGEDIVLWRSPDGSIRVFRDLCIHRGSMLSLGRINDDGRLVCAYHGWEYDGDGICRYIPAQPRDRQRIPVRARAVAYRTEVRYGLVWVAMDEALLPVAPLPEYDDPRFRFVVTYASSEPWKASAARVMENLIDLAHVSIVHTGLLRSGTETEVADYRVDVDEFSIVSTYSQPGSTIYVGDGPEEAWREDWVRFPFTGGIRMRFAHGTTVLFFAVKPVSDCETVLWHLRGRDFDVDTPDAEFIDLDTKVFEQDRRMVEGQRPEMLPVDLAEELHIKGVDAASVEYRRMLKRKTGLMYA